MIFVGIGQLLSAEKLFFWNSLSLQVFSEFHPPVDISSEKIQPLSNPKNSMLFATIEYRPNVHNIRSACTLNEKFASHFSGCFSIIHYPELQSPWLIFLLVFFVWIPTFE